MTFEEAIEGLLRGDFSRLEFLCEGEPSQIVAWLDEGRFKDHPEALAEALSCACFNGKTAIARTLMEHGVDPAAGKRTGMDAIHWAVNRGQLETVQMLIAKGAPLDTINMYEGTALSCALWSAEIEPRPTHAAIIEALRTAGAK